MSSHRPCFKLIVLISVWLTVLFSNAVVEAAISDDDSSYDIAVPRDIDSVKFFLHTTGRGPALFMTGGHSALRVVDQSQNLDVVYNWGIFDWSEKWFALRFLKGDMHYRLIRYPTNVHIKMYQIEKRRLEEQEIYLNSVQKLKLIQLLNAAGKPEQRSYRYHYYFANCSTKILDLLNEVFDGVLKIKLATIQTDRTLRDAVRESFTDHFTIRILLEVIMNQDIDFKMNAYQDSFLPLYLQNHLSSLPLKGIVSNASEVPLLGKENVLVHFPHLDPVGYDPVFIGRLFFTVILLTALLIGFFQRKIAFHRCLKVLKKLSLLTFAIGMTITGMISIFMWGLWLFSEHEHGVKNVALLGCWPTDIFALFLCFKMLQGWRSKLPIWRYFALKTLIVILLTIASFAGFFDSARSQMWMLLLYVHVGFFLLINLQDEESPAVK